MSHLPVISVIITSFNHARYLPKAIGSVLEQSYAPVEIMVVDDGSTDGTAAIVKQYAGVRYIHQVNRGLPAARNTGIDHATGEYLIFLDADDWLFPNAIQMQVDMINTYPDNMAVIGNHQRVTSSGEFLGGRAPRKYGNLYLDLLELNVVGMHATIMFRKQFFDHFRYDLSQKAAEDYDILLQLTRNFPVHMHEGVIAAYLQHEDNMSRNIPLMLSGVLMALHKQEPYLQTAQEKRAFQNGMVFWKNYYTELLYEQKLSYFSGINNDKAFLNDSETQIFQQNNPQYLKKLISAKNKKAMKSRLKNLVGEKNYLSLRKIYKTIRTDQSNLDWGSFKRTKPFSNEFGFDRGKPIDRYYIEDFLTRNARFIKGNVLEIGDNFYTNQFGKNDVVKSDVLHISAVPAATIVGDLSKADLIPIADNSFDCIILTQTLHLIEDYQGAISQCYRMLKNSGVLLLTVPGLSPIDKGEWGKHWLWSFNQNSMKLIMEKQFQTSQLHISVYGNVFSASMFLWGLATEEIPQNALLDDRDELYPVIIGVTATK